MTNRTPEETFAELQRLKELDWAGTAPKHTREEIDNLITEDILREEQKRYWHELVMNTLLAPEWKDRWIEFMDKEETPEMIEYRKQADEWYAQHPEVERE